MSNATARVCVCLALFILLGFNLVTGAFAQTQFFTPGNLVVAVEGCGVQGGTCTNVANGTGNGTGNSSAGGYGDNQGAPLTLFQFAPSGTSSVSFVNSLVLPQTGSGANLPLAGEYGSSSEATLQLSGTGQYLTIMGYGINAATFDANPATYGAAPSLALAQSGSLTGQSYTPVARVLSLIDPYGNVNSSTAVYNIFNTNNPRSAYTLNGTTAYLSGQGSGSDSTSGIFYVPVGATTTAPTAITGLDTTGMTISQDTRDVQIYNNTLYVSVDTKGGSNNARDFVVTLGTPPATSLYNSSAGPTQLTGFGTKASGTLTLTSGSNSNGNGPNAGLQINLSPVSYFFASPSVLYVTDSGHPKNNSANSSLGDGGLQKWVNSQSNGSGTWSLAYTLYQGINLVANTNADGTSGLYGLAGSVSGNTVQLYATNYTLSDLDLTFLYGVTDNLTFTTASQASGESFALLATAPADSNFKGVSFAPALPAGSATITSSPSGLAFTSAGTGCAPGTYTTPVTLIWTPGSSCTLSVVSPQTAASAQYFLSQWQDGTTGTTDHVTAPATSAVYNATFTQATPGIYSPASGSTLTGTSATFQWYGFPNATAFWLDVGSTQGGHDYYSSGSLSTSVLSQTVNSLPANGSTVYATWYYLLNGVWTPTSYSYTALGGSSNKGVITTPPPSSTLSGSSVTFDWTAGTGATAYWIDIGSMAGAHDIYSSGNLGNVLTTTVSGLPTNGSQIYVTLYSMVSGTWLSNPYSYTAYSLAAASGVMTTPTPGSMLTGSTVTFDWTAGSGASGYWIDIGSTTGGHNIYSSGNLGNVLTATVSGLPTDGSTIYVTLYTLIGGTWSGNEYQYITLNATTGIAMMQTPANNAVLSGNTVTFTWSSDANATGYWVDVSAVGPGGNDLDSSGNLGTQTTETVNNLPANGNTVYVTLYSLVGGQWLSNAYTYVSGP
jgi:hypothetical protein